MDETQNTTPNEPSRENPHEHEAPKAETPKGEPPKAKPHKTEGPKTENAETTAEEPTPLSRLEHMRQSLGAEHPDTLAAWRDYTTSLMADKKYAEARPQLGKLVAACEKVFGDKDPVTVNNRADWARCFAETTLYEPALEQYTPVAVRREELLGKQNPATLDARYSVVECLLALQRDADATELLGWRTVAPGWGTRTSGPYWRGGNGCSCWKTRAGTRRRYASIRSCPRIGRQRPARAGAMGVEAWGSGLTS